MTDPVVQLLIDLYDPFDPDRSDLEAYLAMAEEFEARSVLDFGCGTGVLALLLAERGLEVTGIDPSLESLVVAKRDAPARVISIYGAERPVPLLADKVTWLHGFARDLPEMQVDLVVCTGNAMQQAFVDDADWTEILEAMHRVLKPGGRFVFETRDPAKRAWEGWTADATRSTLELPGYGPITVWNDVESVTEEPLFVTHRGYHHFERSDITVISGPETLRFRGKAELVDQLTAAGFTVDEIRDAPDRPGREWVFIARRR
ncbi:MAG: class I SAM-dependent methyltransferase [Thermomicrobiales bacterium]|nr:class I SAM-dependent methyltransferase [Thermomicrobiales bacterium]